MTLKFSLPFLILAGFSFALHAQENTVQFRAILHDPVRPTADLFYTDKGGDIVQLNFRTRALSDAMFALPVNGSLVLYDKEMVDPLNPEKSLAATAKLPAGIKSAIVVVLPAADGEKPAYRMVVIDDSEKAFPRGESRVLPLIGVETAIQAGEHRLAVSPGQITRVPPVRKVNEFNMAQTNFYYKHSGAWTPFTERQLQYVDARRRVFIVHVTPGAIVPKVSTILDTSRSFVP